MNSLMYFLSTTIMSPKAKGVTMKILLDYMQHVLVGKIEDLRKEMHSRFGLVEKRIDTLEWNEESHFAILSMQVENIDKRLDNLEVVEVPRLKKALRMR